MSIPVLDEDIINKRSNIPIKSRSVIDKSKKLLDLSKYQIEKIDDFL